MTQKLSIAEARRIALHAQGFGIPRRTKRAGIRDIAGLIRRLGLLQLDYVNSVIPSHYMVLFSRLGAYPRNLLDELVYERREFIEHWAHEASIVPVDHWQLLKYRRDEHRLRPWPFEEVHRQNQAYSDLLLDLVRKNGPMTAEEAPDPPAAAFDLPGAWTSARRVFLEAHFGFGALSISCRRSNFARVYDLSERVIPEAHHGQSVTRDEAQRRLLALAAKAHGIGTAADLADYYRMPLRDARPRLAELVESGEICPVEVEGWRETAFLSSHAQSSGPVSATTLLSPFDPLVWFRPRAARLFHFDYRVEIFMPREQRKWGVYVLPFLFEERLAARVDLKADREGERLMVLAAYLEKDQEPEKVAAALVSELRALALWLGLETVEVSCRKRFGKVIRRMLR